MEHRAGSPSSSSERWPHLKTTALHHKRQNVSAEAPLFPTDEGAFFKSTESVGKVFARIADDSGIRRFHAHLLRHTWATSWMTDDPVAAALRFTCLAAEAPHLGDSESHGCVADRFAKIA